MIKDNSKFDGPETSNGVILPHPEKRVVVTRPIKEIDDDAPNVKIGAILNSVRRSWKLAFPVAVCLASVGAIVGWFLMVPKYSASAYLKVDADVRPLIFETADSASGGISYRLYQNTQKQLLVTPFVVNAALRDKNASSLAIVRSLPDPVAWLQDQLQVDFPADGEIMEITLETVSPTDCIKLVNAVINAYMAEVVVDSRNERLQRLESLQRVYSEAEAKVRNKRAELKSLAAALRTGDAESLTVAQQTTLQQYGLMQEKLHATQFELMQAEGELEIAHKVLQAQDAKFSTASQANDQGTVAPLVLPGVQTPDIVRLEEQARELEATLASLRFGPNHPTTERLRQKLDLTNELLARRIAHAKEQQKFDSDRALATHRDRLQTANGPHDSRFNEFDVIGLEAQVDVLKHHQAALEKKVGELDLETRELGQSSIDVELMRSEINGLETVLRRVGDEIERTSIELQPKSRVEVISPAEFSTPPNGKKRIAVAAAGGLAGLIAPFFLCVVWDLQRKSVDDAESASCALALSTFGTIPKVSGNPLNDRKRWSRRGKRERLELNESIGAVAGMLLHIAMIRRHRVFLVSSALAGEGKSTVACQLAESLARSGKSVLLVDFDLRRPSIDRYMHLDASPGVSDVLIGEVELLDAVQHTETPNLSVLAAGSEAGNLCEQWTNSALERLFDEFRAEFDIVIVDACPILPVVDARIVGTYCDGVVLTLIRDTSRLPAAAKACEMLRSYGIEILGTIVIGAQPGTYYTSREYHTYQQQARPIKSRKIAKAK